MATTENISIADKYDFRYDVTLEYHPHFGHTNAMHRGRVIAQVSLGRINPPYGDDDREWEAYEERFAEWRDEIKQNIIPYCQQYFNHN